MFTVITENGNGYHCSCCRRTWYSFKEFDTRRGVIEFLSKIEAERRLHNEFMGNYDLEAADAHEDPDVSVQYIFEGDPLELDFDEVRVDRIFREVKALREQVLEARQKEDAEKQRKNDLAILERLKNKYPEE